MLEQQIERDLKAALLAGESLRVSTLRGVKSVLLNVKVATIRRGTELPDDEVLGLLSKEAKKRQESADMYVQGGNQERADKELSEKSIIESYLPAQLSENEIIKIVDRIMTETNAQGQSSMGQVIGLVKQQTKGTADGAIIARLVKEKLSK